MTLLERYIKANKDENFVKNYSYLGNGYSGRLFNFQNTNYRYVVSFIKNYFTFKEAEGIDRSKWEINPNHHQEKLKQHTVRMLCAKFFSKNKSVYYSTLKGNVLELISNSNFSSEEEWILVFILLLDSYFDNTPNYILTRSNDVYKDFLVHDSEKNINKMILDFIKRSKKQNLEELFKHPYMYYDTFHKPYNGVDVLSAYLSASEEERNKLYQYVLEHHSLFNSLNRKKNSKNKETASKAKKELETFKVDVLSKKYTSSGNYDKKMVVDNAKILYLANYLNKTTFGNYEDFVIKLLDFYAKFSDIDIEKVKRFIFDLDNDTFEMCYLNVFKPDYFDDIEVDNDLDIGQEAKILADFKDKSIIEDINHLTKVSKILKKQALEKADYRCELECLNDCSNLYFTSKTTNKNYIEVHHLVPRAFGNDFEVSIETLENYVPLCPRCHKILHHAVDRERRALLNYLFNNRKNGLKNKGIDISKYKLRTYYKIDDE